MTFTLLKEFAMLRTITIGSAISVQGVLERTLPDGRMIVRVGQRLFTGQPV